ncbi:trypsin-like serine protease [Streptomyces microflavus]|uniref:trypsin-like serine protease n=1 Tax=Streptomyces griseus group TaxID=629295 RepID=UPI0036C5B0F5
MALLRRPTGRVLTGTVDTGRWDGGGSLSQGNILIGVTSWGDSCAKSGKPGLYKNVAKCRTWIDTTIVTADRLGPSPPHKAPPRPARRQAVNVGRRLGPRGW